MWVSTCLDATLQSEDMQRILVQRRRLVACSHFSCPIGAIIPFLFGLLLTRFQVVSTSVPWKYEVQQIDVLGRGSLSIADIYLSLEGPGNDTATGSDAKEASWPVAGASLLDSATSAEDLAIALQSLPSAGEVSVSRVPTTAVDDSSVASRHLVTFLSRGGDIPLLHVQKWETSQPDEAIGIRREKLPCTSRM